MIPTQVQLSQPLGNKGLDQQETMCNLSHLARRLSQGQIRIQAIVSNQKKHPLSQRVSCDFTFSKNQVFPIIGHKFEQKEYCIFTHLSHRNEQNTVDRSQECQSFQGRHRGTQAFLYSSKGKIPPTQPTFSVYVSLLSHTKPSGGHFSDRSSWQEVYNAGFYAACL